MRAKGIRRPLEVETRTLEELQEVLALLDASAAAAPGSTAGAAGDGSTGGSTGGGSGSSSGSMITRIMLDNMTRKDAAAPGGRCSIVIRGVWQFHPWGVACSGCGCTALQSPCTGIATPFHPLPQRGWTSALCTRPWP